MKIDKKTFSKILENVKPGLAKSSNAIIEFSNSFALTENAVVTFNDNISVSHPIDNDELLGAVKAEEFLKIIQRIAPDKNGLLDLSLIDNEIVIKGKRAQAGIPFNEGAALPLDEINQSKKKWAKLPKEFIKGIKLATFCVSHDASLPLLTCLHIKGNKISSTNRLRAFTFTMSTKMKSEILLPAAQALILAHYPITHYSLDDYWAHFKTEDDVVISIRIYRNDDNEYPDLSSFFNETGQTLSFPKNIKDVIDRAEVFCQGDTDAEKIITINVQPKKWILKTRTETVGWFKEILPHKGDNEFEFEVPLNFLNDIVSSTTEAELIQDEETETTFLQFETEKWAHVLMVNNVN